MTVPPPTHLSPGAARYLRQPDVLVYPADWTDPWDVHSVREIAHPLWSSINETLDFSYEVVEERIGGVPCERIRAVEARSKVVVLHLHGGMYCLGTPEIDRVLNAPVSLGSGLDVLSVDYRLAPEHPFPAPLDDIVAVWMGLVDQGLDVILLGESAGGGLAAAAALRAQTAGLPMPLGIVLISPMLDLTGASDTFQTNLAVDPDYGHDPDILLAPGRAYAGSTPLDHPLISPLFAELAGLPPMLVHVGGREVLLGDSARFVRRARMAGVEASLHVVDGGWHNSPIWYGVPEADAAISEIVGFMTKVAP